MKLTSALALALVGSLMIGMPTRAKSTVAIRTALERKLPEMKFTGVAFSDCIDYIRDVSGANIHVNWRALEAVGIDKNVQVNLRLRYVTVRQVLSLLLSETGAGDKLTFYPDEGVIEITTREISDKIVYTKVYPIEDLLLEIPDFVGPDFNLNTNGSTSSSNGGNNGINGGTNSGNGGNLGLFGSSSNGSNSGNGTNSSDTKLTKKSDRADALIKLIIDTIQPDIWRQNGGTAGIAYYNGSLIVTAPRSVHEAIGGPSD